MPRITPVSCTGKKPLGIDDKEQDGGDEGGDGDEQRDEAVFEDLLQAAAVGRR